MLLLHVFYDCGKAVANTCVCAVCSYLGYLGDDSFVSMLLNSSVYAQHIVRPNKPQHRSLEQERFIEEPLSRISSFMPEDLSGFQERVFKSKIGGKSSSCMTSVWLMR